VRWQKLTPRLLPQILSQCPNREPDVRSGAKGKHGTAQECLCRPGCERHGGSTDRRRGRFHWWRGWRHGWHHPCCKSFIAEVLLFRRIEDNSGVTPSCFPAILFGTLSLSLFFSTFSNHVTCNFPAGSCNRLHYFACGVIGRGGQDLRTLCWYFNFTACNVLHNFVRNSLTSFVDERRDVNEICYKSHLQTFTTLKIRSWLS
jgi:hypothetical protein